MDLPNNSQLSTNQPSTEDAPQRRVKKTIKPKSSGDSFRLSRSFVIIFGCFSGGVVMAHLGQLAINPQYKPSIPLSVLYGLGGAGGAGAALTLSKLEQLEGNVNGAAAASRVNAAVDAGVSRINDALGDVQQEQATVAGVLDKRQREMNRQFVTFSQQAGTLVSEITDATDRLQTLVDSESTVEPTAYAAATPVQDFQPAPQQGDRYAYVEQSEPTVNGYTQNEFGVAGDGYGAGFSN